MNELSRQLSRLDNARRFYVSRFPSRKFAARQLTTRTEANARHTGDTSMIDAIAALLYRCEEI